MAKETAVVYLGTGRRKTSVARVRLMPGTGKIRVNGKEYTTYFPGIRDRMNIQAPLRLTKTVTKFDMVCTVNGGGICGQAGAIVMGLSRALVKSDDALEKMLRDEGFLTRDARMKERKKYGQKGARARFQFSKR